MFTSVLVLVLAGGPSLYSSAPPTPTFPSGVELITVDAVVVDAKGRPAVGLTQDDFVLLEDGRPQEIVNFESITPLEPDEVPGVVAPPASESAPRIATSAPPARKRSALIVVVDDIHLTRSAAAQARTTLERFLRGSVAAGDRITVFATGTGAAWSGTLPADRVDLLAFVGRLQGRNTSPDSPLMTEYEALRIAAYNDPESLRRAMGRYLNQGACPVVPTCESQVRGDADANQGHNQQLREASLAAIARVTESLGRIHGRTSVLLISEGFIHDTASDDAYRRIVDAAQRANAAIYFIDARGHAALPRSASAEAARDAEIDVPAVASGTEMVRRAMESMALVTHERFTPPLTVGVETMAEETGGFVVHNTSDLAGALDRISRESRSYYLLGYHPTAGPSGVGFRKIEVKVKRAGLHVRARTGYHPSGAPEAPDRSIAADQVPLRLATYTLEPGAEHQTRVVAVTEIDVSGLVFAEHDGRRVAQLDAKLEAIPQDGGAIQERHLSVGAAPPETAETLATGSWRSLQLEVGLPAGAYQVRVTVTDRATGTSSAASQALVVPDPVAFHISTPILSTVMTPATAAGGPSVPIPVAHDNFSPSEGPRLVCAFQVFGASKDAATGRYDVQSRFVLRNRAGHILAAPEASPMAFSPTGESHQIVALPLAQLPADTYDLTITVEDRVAGKKQELIESFTAEGVPVAARAAPPL